MRLKELRGLPVIDPTAARKVGNVTDYQVDPVSGRIAALDITCVDDNESVRILAPRIRRVGHNAVILTARGGAAANAPVEIAEHWLDGSTLIGLEVMGDDGNRIGRLLDASFNQDSLDLDAYLLRATFWERLVSRGGRIVPNRVHACSRELMIVASGRLKELATDGEPSVSQGLGLPLKIEDRPALPTYDQVPDGQPVAAHGR